MIGPAVTALFANDHALSRSFFYTGLLVIVFSIIVGIAIQNFRPNLSNIDHLLGLLLTFVCLPVLLAAPVASYFGDISLLDLYFDMVSCLTTTGAAIAGLPDGAGATFAVWRAEVAWMGGFIIWVAAAAILEPLSLGGFEVKEAGTVRSRADARPDAFRIKEKIWSHGIDLFPWYFGATLLLFVLQVIVGSEVLPALVLSMSVISTSGMMLVPSSGVFEEALVLMFLVLAWSGVIVTSRSSALGIDRMSEDPELKAAIRVISIAVAIVVAANLELLMEIRGLERVSEALHAVWGMVFTASSFLSTAGFESSFMKLGNTAGGFWFPELILAMLALCGGGVATTAGGVKLVRVLALARMTQMELSRLVYPSAVSMSSGLGRNLKVSGQEYAWIVFSIYCVSLALYMLAFSYVGASFKEAAVISVAALTTTGPLAPAILSDGFAYSELGPVAKGLLASAMILGRLELLTAIALFNPSLWRR